MTSKAGKFHIGKAFYVHTLMLKSLISNIFVTRTNDPRAMASLLKLIAASYILESMLGHMPLLLDIKWPSNKDYQHLDFLDFNSKHLYVGGCEISKQYVQYS